VRYRLGALLGVGVLALIGFAVLARRNAWNVDPGSLAAWASAFGTVAAVSFALWKAGDESRRHVQLEERQQADKVSAWISGRRVIPRSMRVDDKLVESVTPIVTISNASSTPIYKVVITIDYVPNPNGEGTNATHHTFVRVVPPGAHPVQLWEPRPHRSRTETGPLIAFTDAAGIHWRRGTDGRLQKLDSSVEDELRDQGEHYGGYANLDGVPS
jgi:hypothetical protein